MEDHGRGILGKRDATAQEIAEAMGHAFREALIEQQRAGNPVPTWDWEKNEVVLVPPEEIAIPDEEDVRDETIETREGRAN
jgi:hypothetical protein